MDYFHCLLLNTPPIGMEALSRVSYNIISVVDQLAF